MRTAKLVFPSRGPFGQAGRTDLNSANLTDDLMVHKRVESRFEGSHLLRNSKKCASPQQGGIRDYYLPCRGASERKVDFMRSGDVSQYASLLSKAAERGLSMVCANREFLIVCSDRGCLIVGLDRNRLIDCADRKCSMVYANCMCD